MPNVVRGSRGGPTMLGCRRVPPLRLARPGCPPSHRAGPHLRASVADPVPVDASGGPSRVTTPTAAAAGAAAGQRRGPCLDQPRLIGYESDRRASALDAESFASKRACTARSGPVRIDAGSADRSAESARSLPADPRIVHALTYPWSPSTMQRLRHQCSNADPKHFAIDSEVRGRHINRCRPASPTRASCPRK
jgi:hypothetical protein